MLRSCMLPLLHNTRLAACLNDDWSRCVSELVTSTGCNVRPTWCQCTITAEWYIPAERFGFFCRLLLTHCRLFILLLRSATLKSWSLS